MGRLVRVVMMQSEVSTITTVRNPSTTKKDTMDIGGFPEPDTAGRISIGNVPDINTTYSLHENTVEMIKRNGDAAIEEELETTTTVKLSEKHIQIISKSSLLNL